MLNRTSIRFMTAAGLLLAAPLAGAHEGLHVTGGFGDGLLHPLTGADHLLVALAAGGWALHGSRGGRWRLALFLAALLGGMLLAGQAVGGVLAVLAPVLLITAMLLPCRFPHVLFAAFALWHGMLHLQEMPATATPPAYVSGLVLMTGLLLAAGRAIARVVMSRRGLRAG